MKSARSRCSNIDRVKRHIPFEVWAAIRAVVDDSERARPLLEAVMKADLNGATGMSIYFTSLSSMTMMNGDDILEAALAYKEKADER